MPQIQDTPYLEQNLPMPFSLEAEQSVLGAVLVDFVLSDQPLGIYQAGVLLR